MIGSRWMALPLFIVAAVVVVDGAGVADVIPGIELPTQLWIGLALLLTFICMAVLLRDASKLDRASTIEDRWHSPFDISKEVARLLGGPVFTLSPYGGKVRRIQEQQFGWTTASRFYAHADTDYMVQVPLDTPLFAQKEAVHDALFVVVGGEDHVFIFGEGNVQPWSEEAGMQVQVHYVQLVN
jgi:hypothetical protein